MYTPKVIVVTGGCGFIGSNFLNYMVDKYPTIKFHNIDKMDYCANQDNLTIKDKDNYFFYQCDITNKNFVSHILTTYDVDTVIHFAAQSHVDNSFHDSIKYTIDNVLGTHNLLECCRKYGKITRFIHISTDEVYGEVDLLHPGCPEKSILNPTNPYSATKASAEMIVNSYQHSYKFPAIITRGNNAYGPNQYPEKLIPKFIKLITEGKKMTIYGSGQSRRNFIHVFDFVTAVETILFHGTINEIYNIGTSNEYSVLEIAEKLIDTYKPGEHTEDWIEFVEDRPFNDFRYAIDSSKLKSLGWKEQKEFEL